MIQKKLNLREIRDQIKRVNLVHIQSFGYPSSLLIFLPACIDHKPVITTLHGGVKPIAIDTFPILEKIKFYIYNVIRLSIGKWVIDHSRVCTSVSHEDLLLIRRIFFVLAGNQIIGFPMQWNCRVIL